MFVGRSPEERHLAREEGVSHPRRRSDVGLDLFSTVFPQFSRRSPGTITPAEEEKIRKKLLDRMAADEALTAKVFVQYVSSHSGALFMDGNTPSITTDTYNAINKLLESQYKIQVPEAFLSSVLRKKKIAIKGSRTSGRTELL